MTGNLTAQQFIVSSSVSFITTSFASGSSKFGDDTGDNHNFTGSVFVTGSLRIPTASSTANIAGTAAGQLFYNTTDNNIYRYNGSTWLISAGTSGTSGTSGSSGANGTSGTSGSSGVNGSSGSSGSSGVSGSSGSSGVSGSSGSSGNTGSSGTSGAAIINNNVANYVLTATGTAGTIQGNAGLTFNAGTLTATTFSGALSGNASTASQITQTLTGTNEANLIYAPIADNDFFRLRVGGAASNSGWVELATADDSTEPIYVRQYSGTFATLTRTATLLDGSGNTSFPGTVSAPTFSGALSGNATTATTAGALTSMNISQFTNNSGYLTSLSDTLATVTARGATTTTSITAERYRGVNSLTLNTFATVNPSSNVFLYSQPNDRDSWIYLDSADTSSNWGIYHRQIDSAVSGLEANSIGFIGGGASGLKAFIGLSTGNGFFAGTISASNFSGTHSGTSSGTNTGDQTNISGNAATATTATNAGNSTTVGGITPIQFFNNMGDSHGTRTSFDASTPSYNFGFRYVQGNGNGPATGGGSQFYSWYLGLGNDYPATGSGSYGMHVAIARGATTPYMSVRYNENNSLGSWLKIAAGYADSAGTLSNNATVSRDLYINGGAGSSVGNRLIVGGTSAPYTMEDTNNRPVIYSTGQYPVITLNHTVTSNGSHGPTLQFTHNTVDRQWVIGSNGTGTQIDFGYSTNTNRNPHNGIDNLNGTTYLRITNGGNMSVQANLLPWANNTYNLGSASLGWANVYTNDLHLSNMNKPEGNDVDGTNGTWTIQEGAENLYIINNNNGKKFKISLEEIK